jgi:GT2 family glycosyltransferase
LTRAVNEGADYVFLLNQDAWVEPETIEKLISAQTSEYAILSPVHLNAEGDALDFAFAKYMLCSLTPEFMSDIYLNRLKPLYEIQFANAAAWLLNRKCVELVGGFDPSFFMRGEDDDYVQRVKYWGLKVGICPSAKMHHDRQCSDYNNWGGLYAKKKGIILYFKDLNRSLMERILRFVISQSKATVRDILHLRFRNIIMDIYTVFHLMVSFREIVGSRKQAKQRWAFIKPILGKR